MKNNKPSILAITVSLFILSLGIFFLTSYGLHIQRLVLKNDLFDHTTKPYEFVFDQLNNGRYRVKLKLLKDEGTNNSGVFENRVNFEIGIRLTDAKNNLVVEKVINKDSKSLTGYTRDFIEMTLFSFEARRNEKYRLKISFVSNEGYFDLFLRKSNVLFVEEDYDPAAMPWLHFMHFISKVMSAISFLISMLLVYLIMKKKNGKKRDSDCWKRGTATVKMK